MKFGIRECANVVFRAKADQKIGNKTFRKNQPVLYIDTAKTSTMEGAATTVYATGGRGNTNLVAWEGEKTLTFTVEDALLSPIGFSILSGAGLFKGEGDAKTHVHQQINVVATIDEGKGTIDASELNVCKDAPIWVMEIESDGSLTGAAEKGILSDDTDTDEITFDVNSQYLNLAGDDVTVALDYYELKKSANVNEMIIDAAHFGGYYYVEAETLFRSQATGEDMPAIMTLPNVKIQSNFTFNLASTGDPSTFTFTMDAMPDYTYFDKSKKVLCVIQMIESDAESVASTESWKSVMEHSKDNTHPDKVKS